MTLGQIFIDQIFDTFSRVSFHDCFCWSQLCNSLVFKVSHILYNICFMSFFIFIFIPSVDVMQFLNKNKNVMLEKMFIYSIRLCLFNINWFMGANIWFIFIRLRHLYKFLNLINKFISHIKIFILQFPVCNSISKHIHSA